MSTSREWLTQQIARIEAARDDIPVGLDENGANQLAAYKSALSDQPTRYNKFASTELPIHSSLSTNPPVIPEGWVMVPVKPTYKMLISLMGLFTSEELHRVWGGMIANAPPQQ